MKQHTAQIATWAVAIILTTHLTWTAVQHRLPVLDTATIALFSLAGTRTAIEHIARTANIRKTGANR